MKYICIILSALIITSCNRVKYVEFTGDIHGIDNGVFVIKDLTGNPVCSESIFDGKFHVKQILQTPGYYSMFIVPDITKDYKRHLYDVYLEAGTYTISGDTSKLDVYPAITSTSATQNELTDYYSASTAKLHEAKAAIQKMDDKFKAKDAPAIYSQAYNDLTNQITNATAAMGTIEAAAFEAFVNKHHQNMVEAHILAGIDYKKDPDSYALIYQKFTPEQKSTGDGKAEGDDLNTLAKLSPGLSAPAIAGKTPDGKTFNPAMISGKKIVLVEFWQSDNQVSRDNHQKLIIDMASPLKNSNFTAISISLDTKPDVWKAAIKQDELSWTQLSDLKGEDSPNMVNWSVNTTPTYDLVDGSWHIIKLNVEFSQLSIEVNDYLKSH